MKDRRGPPPADAARVRQLEARVEELEAEIARDRERLHDAAAMIRARDAELHAKAAEIARIQRTAGRFRRRRSVRAATTLAAMSRRFLDRARWLVSTPRRALRSARRRVSERLDDRRRRASPAAERDLIRRIRRDSSRAKLTTGPLVSIVILNRDGREHLERCLRAVALTTYRDVEIIVVDNGSTDHSAEFVEQLTMPFPVTVLRNAQNRSFSAANAQGVAAAAGELICFLNNDVDPITEDWLGYLVETMGGDGVVAVGARLIYSRHRGGVRGGMRFADLTLQHRGVAFDRASGVPMPKVIGAGEDPMSPDAVAVVERPALTAACLLVERAAFEAAGGFSTAYDYGLEDVDLCLKLRAAGGRLIYDGRAALWHYESATRAADAELHSARVLRNREAYVDAWGPRIFRESILEALAGDAGHVAEPLHVAITITSLDPDDGFGDWYTAHELGDALQASGWQASYLERKGDGWYQPGPSVDAVIVLLDACDIRRLPRHLITVAWLRSWPDRWLDRTWFDDFDLVFASSGLIVDSVAERSAKQAVLLPLATDPEHFRTLAPTPDRACDVLFVGNYWGQHRAVVDALPALATSGLSVHVYGRGWEAVPAMAPLHRGFLAYADVPSAYASARIVVDDAAEPTLACGSVNSRVFDALSAGAIVVTNGRPGVHALFDDGFPTWSDGSSLLALIEAITAEPGPYEELMSRYRGAVLAEHTYDLRAALLRDRLFDWARATRYGLRISVPSYEVADAWGDYHFARATQRALERAGHPTRVHLMPAWPEPVTAREDVVLDVVGLHAAPTRSGQVNLLWQISHPDRASPDLYDRYDHVFVASDPFAARMAELVNVPVSALHQATDPGRFKPDPSGPSHELLYVANSRFVRRRIVADLDGTSHDLAVYGLNWRPDLIDQRYVKGEGIPNAELARYYSSSAIVLNDHWEDMRDEGFISNRIYDALACGAFVISDDVAGIDTEFDGSVVTYTTRAELLGLIDRYLADPAERRRLGERGRAAVLERHTFEARVRAIEEVVATRSPSRPVGDPPSLPTQSPRSSRAAVSAKGN